MADALKKVSKGSPLIIPADTFNTFVDAAQDYLQGKQAQGTDRCGVPLPAGVVLVRNDSAQDQVRFAVLAITGVVFNHEDSPTGFENGPTFTANKPTGADSDKIVILTEPIADGRMGRAMIAGVTPVQLAVASEGDTCAKTAANVTATLATGSSGPVRILWKESGTGTKWGVVQYPVGGGSSAAAYARISARAGTSAPWLYSAEVVVRTGNTRVATGQTLSWNLRNLAEEGPSGAGGNPMQVGDIVAFWPDGDGYACERSPAKGTY